MILAASLGGTPRDVSVCLLHVYYPSGSCYFGFQAHHSQLHRLGWQARSSLSMCWAQSRCVTCWLLAGLFRIAPVPGIAVCCAHWWDFTTRGELAVLGFCCRMWGLRWLRHIRCSFCPRRPGAAGHTESGSRRKADSVCCTCEKCQRHDREAWDRNKINLRSISDLTGLRSSQA